MISAGMEIMGRFMGRRSPTIALAGPTAPIISTAVGDYIRVPYSNTLSFPHDLSVAAWIKTTDDAGGIAHEHNGGSDGNFVFGLSQGGRLRFGRSASGGRRPV